MRSGQALAADSELQAPGCLVLAESYEGLERGHTCWSAENLGWGTEKQRFSFCGAPLVSAGPTGGRQGGICHEGMLCRTEAGDTLEGSLLKIKWFTL